MFAVTGSRHSLVVAVVAANAILGAVEVRSELLEEVVVTATKRETLLQKTSESLQVLGGMAMSDRGMEDFDSYFLSVPSLSQADSRGPGNKRYAIRGVQSAGEPLVALYLDDVALLGSSGESLDPGGSQPDLKLWDVQRLEVLKGPQGTLYGNGSGGGSIRIITNKPDLTGFDISARASAASVSEGGQNSSVSGMVNVPIVEGELAARLAVYSHRDDGYIDEVYLGKKDANYADTDGGRLALQWTPNDRTTVDLMLLGQKTVTGAEFELFEFLGDDSPRAAQLVDTGYDDRLEVASLNINYSFDNMDLFYSGAYQKREVERLDDQTRFLAYGEIGLSPADCPESSLADGSCVDFMNGLGLGTVAPLVSAGEETGESTSHELRLTSTKAGPWQWLLGAFYEDRDTERRGHVTGTNRMGRLDGTGTTVFARNNWGTREQMAAFGEVGYDFLPSWTFTVGLRWFEVERTEEQTTVVNAFGPVGPLPFEGFSESDVVSRFKLSWDASEDLFFYALAAEGFRVGGPNQPVGFESTAPDFDSDSLWNYELGWKTSLFGGDTNLNGAIYYVDWKDIQFLTTDQTGAFELIGNGGAAEVKGFELELQSRLFDNLEISGGIGYSDARFKGSQPEQALLQNQSRDGDRLPGVPKWSTTLFAQYTVPLSNGANALVNADWAYRSDSTTGLNPDAANYRELDGYHQFNIRGGMEWSHWKVMLEISNVLDDRPEVAGRVYDLEPYQFATTAPRTIGVTVDYRYR